MTLRDAPGVGRTFSKKADWGEDMPVRGFFRDIEYWRVQQRPQRSAWPHWSRLVVAVDSGVTHDRDTIDVVGHRVRHDMVSIAVAGRHDTPDASTVKMLLGAIVAAAGRPVR